MNRRELFFRIYESLGSVRTDEMKRCFEDRTSNKGARRLILPIR